ncbi:MAG: glycosyltransferase family 2 protein [Phycisphaerales bacterium]
MPPATTHSEPRSKPVDGQEREASARLVIAPPPRPAAGGKGNHGGRAGHPAPSRPGRRETLPASGPALSVILPARDEAAALPALLREILAILDDLCVFGSDGEVIVVDDGSRDATAACVASAASADRRVRLVDSGGAGQTIAMARGIAAARGRVIALMDADGQNDPSDLPRLLARLAVGDVDFVQGDRTESRCDGWRRRFASAVGRGARRLALGDAVRDTGCTLRVMDAAIARALPLDRPGMHRFIPVLAAASGARVAEVPVNHRPRMGGRTHYRVFGRAWPGLRDCVIVRRRIRAARDAAAAVRDTASSDVAVT